MTAQGRATVPTSGVDVYQGSAYAMGACPACEAPSKAVIVTVLRFGSLIVTVCAEHHNRLLALLVKEGQRREI